jgi:hypothetical protein
MYVFTHLYFIASKFSETSTIWRNLWREPPKGVAVLVEDWFVRCGHRDSDPIFWLVFELFDWSMNSHFILPVLMFLTGNFAGHALTQLGNNTVPPVGQPQTTSPPNQQASTNTGGGGNGGTVNIVISPISR